MRRGCLAGPTSSARSSPASAPTCCSSTVLPSTSPTASRSEEHTSELQSRQYLVCRLLLANKQRTIHRSASTHTRLSNTATTSTKRSASVMSTRAASPGSSSRSARFFFFNDTATTEIYTLSLHDALPIFDQLQRGSRAGSRCRSGRCSRDRRSEEHTSELQSRQYLVCRLLLEKKKQH